VTFKIGALLDLLEVNESDILGSPEDDDKWWTMSGGWILRCEHILDRLFDSDLVLEVGDNSVLLPAGHRILTHGNQLVGLLDWVRRQGISPDDAAGEYRVRLVGSRDDLTGIVIRKTPDLTLAEFLGISIRADGDEEHPLLAIAHELDQASVSLDTLEVTDGYIKDEVYELVLQWAVANIEILADAWSLVRNCYRQVSSSLRRTEPELLQLKPGTSPLNHLRHMNAPGSP
jgi:hypothetical protein